MTESHERSRAACYTASDDEELYSTMRHEGFKRDERPCSVLPNDVMKLGNFVSQKKKYPIKLQIIDLPPN